MYMLSKFEKILKALSDKNRIRIIKMLQRRALCVCEIRAILKLANSTVSKHLKILREAGLITDWKEGKWINYKINLSGNDNLVSNALLFIQMQVEDEDIIKRDKIFVERISRYKIICNK